MLRLLDKLKGKLHKEIDNQFERDEWVISQINDLGNNSKILDAGCGSQRYRYLCDKLKYYAQDFGEVSIDEKKGFTGLTESYSYGELSYKGNIWDVDEVDDFFDAILCTEVLEHIPYPENTLKEFSRLLKPGGTLILTFPSNCLRHMDPYFYSSGYSDNYIKHMLDKYGFENLEIQVIGNYYQWMFVELVRTSRNFKLIGLPLLLPSMLYFFIKSKFADDIAINTLCGGYMVSAVKKAAS